MVRFAIDLCEFLLYNVGKQTLRRDLEMKAVYTSPELDVVERDAEDVITTSGYIILPPDIIGRGHEGGTPRL